ncbi:MAG: ABC transporter ATP-binding protein [Gammaproteobacteria bacterium]|nr:ABC transporter ATP-binding protein [Gammaproteobacteria bacterium]MBU1415693.1 ABC transporter ATP-binding protein [Gammaproteobacteria bacterium]
MTPALPAETREPSLAIDLSGIVKHYRMGEEDIPALRGVDLEVPVGTFLAVRGPSGSGKSTLLNICGLIDAADRGRYLLAGENVAGLDEEARTMIRRRAIGFVFQSYNLVPVMSVRDNIEYPLLLLGQSVDERRARVDEILGQVGLSGMADRRPDQLSGGQRQRVAIARALVKSPTLVIADEPTANLDTTTASQVIDLMRALGHRHNATFLIATHDDRMTAHCDAVHSITDGVLQ